MRFAAALLLSAAVLSQPAAAQDSAGTTPAATQAPNQAATQAATRAAEAWLALTDHAKYVESWTAAAAAFRAAVTQQQWSEAVRAARAPFGALKSRKLAGAQFTRTLPGAPDGEYVVIQYQTEFAARAATETVVPMREADGSWKVSGYVIR